MQHVDALEAQQVQAANFSSVESTHDATMSDQQKHARHGFPQHMISPAKRQANGQSGFYSFGHTANVPLAENSQAYGGPATSGGFSFMSSGHQ